MARYNSRPKKESETWAAGSWRMRKHPSKVFLVLFLQKKNGTLQHKVKGAKNER